MYGNIRLQFSLGCLEVSQRLATLEAIVLLYIYMTH